MFARFVWPLRATILCVRESWSGSNNHVNMNHVFHWLAKKLQKKEQTNKQKHKPEK